MKRTLLTVAITVAVMSLLFYVSSAANSVRRKIDQAWLMSAVKAPVRIALDEIQTDLNAGRYDVAKLKIAAFKKQWSIFEQAKGFSSQGIGNIMVEFATLDQTNAPGSQTNHPAK
jgi:hypothetical protein